MKMGALLDIHDSVQHYRGRSDPLRRKIPAGPPPFLHLPPVNLQPVRPALEGYREESIQAQPRPRGRWLGKTVMWGMGVLFFGTLLACGLGWQRIEFNREQIQLARQLKARERETAETRRAFNTLASSYALQAAQLQHTRGLLAQAEAKQNTIQVARRDAGLRAAASASLPARTVTAPMRSETTRLIPASWAPVERKKESRI